MKDKKKIGLILMYLSFGIVMAGLGANDALRGVFSPIFKDHFTLSSVQISMIIVMSYAGNLIFLWAGTRLADRFEKKKQGGNKYEDRRINRPLFRRTDLM